MSLFRTGHVAERDRQSGFDGVFHRDRGDMRCVQHAGIAGVITTLSLCFMFSRDNVRVLRRKEPLWTLVGVWRQ